jgi:transposase
MGKPYSLDIRQRICAYVAKGHSARAAGRVFGVSAATAVRFAAEYRTRGSVDAKRQGRPPGRFRRREVSMSELFTCRNLAQMF